MNASPCFWTDPENISDLFGPVRGSVQPERTPAHNKRATEAVTCRLKSATARIPAYFLLGYKGNEKENPEF